MTTISLEGLDHAAVLAALYNASRPQGMGFLHYEPTPMTVAEAATLLKDYTYFDYLKGRVMKVDLGSDELDPRLYDRDNGEGAAARAIEALRSGGEATITEMHEAGKQEAAKKARKAMGRDHQEEHRDGMVILELGLSDVADQLGPAVDRATE